MEKKQSRFRGAGVQQPGLSVPGTVAPAPSDESSITSPPSMSANVHHYSCSLLPAKWGKEQQWNINFEDWWEMWWSGSVATSRGEPVMKDASTVLALCLHSAS